VSEAQREAAEAEMLANPVSRRRRGHPGEGGGGTSSAAVGANPVLFVRVVAAMAQRYHLWAKPLEFRAWEMAAFEQAIQADGEEATQEEATQEGGHGGSGSGGHGGAGGGAAARALQQLTEGWARDTRPLLAAIGKAFPEYRDLASVLDDSGPFWERMAALLPVEGRDPIAVVA